MLNTILIISILFFIVSEIGVLIIARKTKKAADKLKKELDKLMETLSKFDDETLRKLAEKIRNNKKWIN